MLDIILRYKDIPNYLCTMSRRILFAIIVVVAGVFFTACGTSKSSTKGYPNRGCNCGF